MTAQYEFTGIRRQAYQNGDPQSSRYHTSGGLPLNENARDGTDVSFIQGHQILGLYDGTDFFYHISDGLSSVRVLIDATGSAVAHFTTNEFGIPEPPTGPRADLDFMTYQGSLGVRNDSSGLYYARHRYYDPALGRWLSADPIGFEGGLNLYAGMGNNPTTYVDPEGLEYGPKEFTVDFGFMVLGFGFAMLDGPEPGPADCFAYAQAGPSAARVSAKALDIALEQRRAIGAAIAGIPFLHITLAKMFDGSGSGDNSVYIGNKGGRDCYVGITKNLAKRQAQHGPRFKIEELIGELTRNQARAIEQSLIESARALGRNYHNLRNSISPTRAKEFYKGAKAWAEEYLKKNKIGLPPR
jgi:RHS repeat-associated protein